MHTKVSVTKHKLDYETRRLIFDVIIIYVDSLLTPYITTGWRHVYICYNRRRRTWGANLRPLTHKERARVLRWRNSWCCNWNSQEVLESNGLGFSSAVWVDGGRNCSLKH